MTKPRARDLGLDFLGETGEHNAITDVPGVLVGACTRIEGEGEAVTGKGPVRTGVTAILPRGINPEPQPVWAGIHALNGNGEMTGSHWVKDGGYFIGPVCITNTHNVSASSTMPRPDGSSRPTGELWGEEHLWAMPIVAETYDGLLNDINGQHVREADARARSSECRKRRSRWRKAIPVAARAWFVTSSKGGTGTARRACSEVDGDRFTMGAIVQANHGTRPWFSPLGVPVGRHMTEDRLFLTVGAGVDHRHSRHRRTYPAASTQPGGPGAPLSVSAVAARPAETTPATYFLPSQPPIRCR